jgi:nicotinamidase-related amidase
MQLDAKTTALILIDLQRGVLAMPLAPHSAATVYERAQRIADRFRAAGALVVRVRVSFSRDLADTPRAPVDQPMKYGAPPPGWDEFELVVAEDLCSALDADMHAFSFRHILPRLARVTSSEGVTLE